MAHNRFRGRLLTGMRDPWALLLSTFGGATAWAFGTAIPLAVTTTAMMLGVAAIVGALTRSRDETSASLRAGTPQQGLINLLDGHVRSLRTLRSKALPDVVRPRAEAALAPPTPPARPYCRWQPLWTR